MRPAATPLLTLLFGVGALGDASANYTAQLLSSGTIKLGDWQAAYDKAYALVQTLNTTEKLSIITGGSGGNFSPLAMLDSSTNPLTYFYVTTWPAGAAMAMTWDKDAILGQGSALGAEFRGKGINLAYAPTLEPLGRSAWCGRTGETYGADSHLNGAMGGNFVKGMASAGVIPSSKHFIMNEQETNRDGSGSSAGGGGGLGGGSPPSTSGNSSTISARQSTNSTTTSNSATSDDSSESYSVAIGDKAFHETYLTPFYDAVKSGVAGTMCAMNKANGTYSCESQDLLGKYLKAELGMLGIVHADVGAQHSGINSANAGMDYGSSSDWSEDTLGVGLTNGSFTTARLDDMVIRNMMGYFHYNQDQEYPTKAGVTDYVDVRGNHSTLARSYAANSLVLLKNTNNALPLKDKRSISIFGYHAAQRSVGANTALTVYNGVGPTMLGHMSTVGGSAMGSLAYVTTPVQKFIERAATDGFMLRWWLNDTTVSSFSGMSGSGTELAESTLGVASNSDVCICFLNAWSGEGGDRSELYNATQDALVNAVADNCNNTIVVINTTGPRLVDQWISHENVTGVIYGGPLGQESGNAIDDVLFGTVNPSGRLIHTIAKNESDYDSNTQITQSLELDYSEGNYIDYKYFDKYNSSTVTVTPNTTALAEAYSTGDLAIGGREDLWDVVATVSTSISNTGSLAGAEVAQLYITFPDAADEPVRQLRGFEKVAIQPGESATVTFELKRRDLSVWDVSAQNWKIESGDYIVYVGASSRDFKAKTILTV
ncbi:glycoside hydrolase [Acephala macrosclerotiorum]|nr:glycoside hydrolase [Acephala macrosclerotiorum]